MDYGTWVTETRGKELEKRIREVYEEAAQDIEKKLDDFNKKYAVKEAKYAKQVQAGKITQKDFDAWKRGQVFQGKQWQAKKDQITNTLINANKVSVSLINGQTSGVFAANANYMAYALEHGAGVNFGFGLYDTNTVDRLLRDDPQMLPKWKIDEPKEYVWNQKKVNTQITQGIIQGEKLDEIAKRLGTNLASQNENLMKTFARTAMTGAQNEGRLGRLYEAERLGINVKKQWMATLDGRTRDSHADIDGESVPVRERFSNGCKCPGDPTGPAHEVYNCRCTMVYDLLDYPAEYQRYDNIDGKPIKNMTYRQWEKAKSGEPVYTDFLGIRKSLGNDFVNAMETMLNFTPETDVKDLFYKYQNVLRVSDTNLTGSGAYFAPADGGIHINANKIQQGDDLHVPYQTVFHEFGHNIDNALSGRKYGWASSDYKNGALEAQIKKDWHEFRVKYVMEHPGDTIMESEYTFRGVLRFMAERESKADPYSTEWYKLVRLHRSGKVTMDDIFEKYGEKMTRAYLQQREWCRDMTDRDILKMLKSESLPLHARGSVSDIIGGLFSSRDKRSYEAYALGAGHSSDYWWKYKLTKAGEKIKVSSGNLPLEFFAEVIDGKAANPESLAQMRRIFPKAVKIVEKIIQEAINVP